MKCHVRKKCFGDLVELEKNKAHSEVKLKRYCLLWLYAVSL